MAEKGRSKAFLFLISEPNEALESQENTRTVPSPERRQSSAGSPEVVRGFLRSIKSAVNSGNADGGSPFLMMESAFALRMLGVPGLSRGIRLLAARYTLSVRRLSPSWAKQLISRGRISA